MKFYYRLLPIVAVMFSVLYSQAQSLTRDDLKKFYDTNEYIAKHHPSRQVIDSLLATLPNANTTITIADMAPVFDKTMSMLFISKAVDGLYLSDGLRQGIDLDEARDAVSFTTLYPFRRPNDRDYRKLFDVFSVDSPLLHRAYLEKIPFMLRNSGPSEHTGHLRELISANVAESPLKAEALKVIDDFMPLAPGQPAPEVTLLDENGRQRSLADYKGRLLVVDIWATWCHNCRKKIPEYLAMAAGYDKDRVTFINLSIDKPDSHEKWLEASQKHSIPSANNLIVVPADDNGKSPFENIYCVGGVPRYILIGSDGNIIDAFAPTQLPTLKALIDTNL